MKKLVLLGLLQATIGVLHAQSLSDVERAFSKLSSEIGFLNAVKQYADDSLVLLRPNHFPIKGQNLESYLESKWPENLILTWEPANEIVAKSGELGYTYGTYTLTTRQADGSQTIETGTYASIWRKNDQLQWKLVLDTGNEGLTPKK